MRMHRILPCATAVLMATGGAAMAQSVSETPDAKPMTPAPQAFTCSQLTALENAKLPGVLYFLSGYGQAQQQYGGQTGTPGAASGSQGIDQASNPGGPGAGSGPSVNAGNMGAGAADMAMSGGSDGGNAVKEGLPDAAMAGGNSSSVAQSEGAAGASADSAIPGRPDPDLSRAAETRSAADQKTPGSPVSAEADQPAALIALEGYFDIPVQEIADRCREQPDAMVYDILYDNGVSRSGGSQARPDSGNR